MTRKLLLSEVIFEGDLDKICIHLNFENHMKHLDHTNHYNQIVKPKC